MDIINIVLWLFALGIVAAVVWWAVDAAGLPAPFPMVIRAVTILIILVILLKKLLPLAGLKI